MTGGGQNGHRPWWAVAIMGGFGAVLAVLFGLGLIGHPAKADEGRLASIEARLPSKDDNDRLTRIEARVNEIERAVGRIEGKLERGK